MRRATRRLRMGRVLGLVCCLATVAAVASGQDDDPVSGWSYFGGSAAFTRYAPLDQIDRRNVSSLGIVWRRPALGAVFTQGFPELRPTTYLRSTPILVDGLLFVSNAVGLVEAFDPGTGETVWIQQPPTPTLEGVAGRGAHGVAFWTDGIERRILSLRNNYLHALDAATGRAVQSFGAAGRVDLTPEGARRANGGSSPIVVGDVVVVAGTVDGAGDSGVRWKGTVPENVRGYDVRTGELRWTFHVVPKPGEFGADTWGAGSLEESGDLGAWCCLSADLELGYVYVPLTAPTAAYYGGHRPGDNLFSNSLVALHAETGERVWHFQMVHHDLWEYDTIGPPTLGEITVDGRRIRAVMQPSKTGFLYVFDRQTGEPVWPIEERPVPPSTVPGEQASPTQPFPTKPPPFAHHGVTEDDLLDFSPELAARARETASTFVLGPIFTPPSIVSDQLDGTQGTLALPGSWGSGNWNTGAFDPETGLYYAFSHVVPRVYRLADASDRSGTEMAYYSPNRDAPYLDGLPLIKPPWGRITAIDLNRGTHAWQVANGRGLREHPALLGLDLPPLGVASRPVALVTATLLFIGEGGNVFGGIQPNMWGRTFRAYDKGTGNVLWETDLPAGTTGGPMTYLHDDKQFIVVPIGGQAYPAEWVALALP
ncbi:MAG: PQQ-binding-like beta-propeller repeat protein [Acidobacteriota bacterium]|nr:PQQ-binding-like beta-propeller repeat protein [Acidobacteriota bacterium]